MSKFLIQKRKLIEDVFEKASSETTESSFSGILKSLERTLLDDFKITLSYKTFEAYYNSLIQRDEDYNIKPLILDELSIYLGYNNFKEYCAEWKTMEYSIKESISNVVINVINKPILKMPEFLTKQSNLGFLGILLCVSLLVGKHFLQPKNEFSSEGLGILDHSKQCMYWNGKEYVPEYCNKTKTGLIAIDLKLVDNFKKVERLDTITRDNYESLWYSKYRNKVEFFTADGINPENGKALNKVSKGIFEKYIEGQPIPHLK